MRVGGGAFSLLAQIGRTSPPENFLCTVFMRIRLLIVFIYDTKISFFISYTTYQFINETTNKKNFFLFKKRSFSKTIVLKNDLFVFRFYFIVFKTSKNSMNCRAILSCIPLDSIPECW